MALFSTPPLSLSPIKAGEDFAFPGTEASYGGWRRVPAITHPIRALPHHQQIHSLIRLLINAIPAEEPGPSDAAEINSQR